MTKINFLLTRNAKLNTFPTFSRSLVFFLLLGLSFQSCKIEPVDLELPCETLETAMTLENRNEGVDYIISCDWDIRAKLTIEPGTMIEFQNGAGLKVEFGEGVLNAVGTASEPIIFTGSTTTKGSWKGITFGRSDINNVLDHCVIEFAGSESVVEKYRDAAVEITGKASITNTTIRNSKGNAIGIAYDGVDNADVGNFSNNIFEDNEGYPIYTAARHIQALNLNTCTFTNNGMQKVAMYIYNSNRDLAGDNTWVDAGIPYFSVNSIAVTNDLILEEGVNIRFASNAGLEVVTYKEGSLKVNGTAENPVILMGDTELPGAWKGIYVGTNNINNNFNHLHIKHGGSEPYLGDVKANITLGDFVGYDTRLSVSNTQVSESDGCGLYDYGKGTSLTTDNITFSSNRGSDLCD